MNEIDSMNSLVPIYHVGSDGCQNIAFYFKQKLEPGDVMIVSNVVAIDSTSPQAGDKIVCGACKKEVNCSLVRIFGPP